MLFLPITLPLNGAKEEYRLKKSNENPFSRVIFGMTYGYPLCCPIQVHNIISALSVSPDLSYDVKDTFIVVIDILCFKYIFFNNQRWKYILFFGYDFTIGQKNRRNTLYC